MPDAGRELPDGCQPVGVTELGLEANLIFLRLAPLHNQCNLAGDGVELDRPGGQGLGVDEPHVEGGFPSVAGDQQHDVFVGRDGPARKLSVHSNSSPRS